MATTVSPTISRRLSAAGPRTSTTRSYLQAMQMVPLGVRKTSPKNSTTSPTESRLRTSLWSSAGWALAVVDMAAAVAKAAKAILSDSDAARFLRDGGSINTSKLDTYHAMMTVSAIFGAASAVFLAVEVARFMRSKES